MNTPVKILFGISPKSPRTIYAPPKAPGLPFAAMDRVSHFVILALSFFLSNSWAQISPGTYSVVSLGTAGSHANSPGSKGTLTIASNGNLRGSLYSYNERKSTRVSGTVSLATGRGTLSSGRSTSDVSFKTSTKTFFEMTYRKKNSSSRGIAWGVR